MKILTILPITLFATAVLATENNDLDQIGTLEQGKARYQKSIEWAKNYP